MAHSGALTLAAQLHTAVAGDHEAQTAVVQYLKYHPLSLWHLAVQDLEDVRGHFEDLSRVLRLGPLSLDARLIISVQSDRRSVEIFLPIEDIWLCYLPLCIFIRKRAESSKERLFVGIAGCAAAGKTTFSHAMQQILTALSCSSVGIGQDAYHHTNAELVAMGLRTFKGRWDTFDVAKMAADLSLLHTAPAARLPLYDRTLHNPVPDALAVSASHRVVIVEGLFLLLRDGRWDAVGKQLDISIFLRVPLAAAREQASLRKSATNNISIEDAYVHFDKVDRINFDVIEASSASAWLCLTRDADFRLRNIQLHT